MTTLLNRFSALSGRLRTLVLAAGILAVAGLVLLLIFATEPTAQTSGATKVTPMLVQVTSVTPDTVRPTIRAMGTVRPRKSVVLSARVEGPVIRQMPAFEPGENVREGEVLLRLDPADYETAVQQRASALRQAESALQLELGRQNVAQQDYELLGDTLSAADRELILRKPQLNAARSEVEAARAALEQARLDLERTVIRAPFNAHVVERTVSVGSQVARGDALGRLVGQDAYWVEATVPLSAVGRLSEPGDAAPPARIRNRTAWEEDQFREGRLTSVVGALEDDTRMARVLVTVPDPAATSPEYAGAPPLLIGSYVEAELPAETLEGVVPLSRDYLREDDTVWLMEGDSLKIQPVNVVFRDATHAYVDDGLEANDRVITSNLSTVQNGAPLRLASDGAPADSTAPSGS